MAIRFLCGSVFVCACLFCLGRKVEAPLPDESDMKTVVDASNRFGLKLYQQLCEKDSGNIFCSPFSVSTAMAMVFEGARDWTADEMHDVFQFPLDAKIRHESFSALYQQLNKKDAKYKLNTANALWVQKGYGILPEYLGIVRDYYYGNAVNVDFIGAAEQARLKINGWVEDKTNNKIKDLFPPGSLSADSRLVITNAIYFKGTWVKQFDKNLTAQEDFTISSEKKKKVPMMRRTDAMSVFNYGEAEGLQVLEMPYEGEDLSMVIILPESDRLKSIEDSLNPEKLNEWMGMLEMRRVDVYVPKFTFETKYLLNDKLMAMGMPNAFSPHADLSGIDGSKNLFIQIVVHQAYVDVNEEGTEAAAATGVGIGITSVGPRIPVFRADHPFIFLIRHRQSGNILFLGRVLEPG